MSPAGTGGTRVDLPVRGAALLDLADGRVPLAAWWRPAPGLLGVPAPAADSGSGATGASWRSSAIAFSLAGSAIVGRPALVSPLCRL
jgi:hypothetical protein